MQVCASLTFATKSINIIVYCPSAMLTIFSSTFFHFDGDANDETKKDQSCIASFTGLFPKKLGGAVKDPGIDRSRDPSEEP